MGKYCTLNSIFKYKWDQVITAFWHRYPNPSSTHVLSEDVIERYVKDGKLYTKRLLTKTNKIPPGAELVLPAGTRKVYICEESVTDLDAQTLTTYTRNIGLTRIMMLEEKCVYKPSAAKVDETICERHAWVSSKITGFARAIQVFRIERFKSNVSKTVKGYNFTLEKMFPVILENQKHSLTSEMKEKAIKAKEKAGQTYESAKEKAGQTYESAMEKAEQTLGNAKEKAGQTLGSAKQKAGQTIGKYAGQTT